MKDPIPRPGGFVKVSPELERTLGGGIAATNAVKLLSHLVFLAREEDEWIQITRQRLLASTNLSVNQQEYARRLLVDKGLVEVRYDHKQFSLAFRINYKALGTAELAEQWGKTGAPLGKNRPPLGNHTDSSGESDHMVTRRARGRTFQNTNTREGAVGKFEETCAQKLYQIVKDQFGLKQDTKLWPEWFAKLQEKEVSKERIKKAIVWYAKHALDKMAPHVEDAAEFYREFGRIENAIRREEDTSANVEIMPELQPLIDRLLLECYWPKGSARDLPGVVQRSFDNYAAWWKKRGKLLKRLPPDNPHQHNPHRLRRFDKELDARAFDHPMLFIPRYFRNLSRRLTEWREWHGSLEYFIVSENHPDFQRMGAEVSQYWTGGGTWLWERYFKATNED